MSSSLPDKSYAARLLGTESQRAIAISFKQLAQDHPEAELDIVAVEQRGEGNLLLKAKTAPDADRSALSAEYFQYYTTGV